MWILLFGDETGDESFIQGTMVWWLGRMVNVAKRLSDENWTAVGEEMIACLAQKQGKAGYFEEILQRWRHELMAAPLSWWPEPVT